jgi:hypothetical protein
MHFAGNYRNSSSIILVIGVDQSCWSYREVELVGEPRRTCWPLTEGEIFLHSLLIGRSVIEDPPSISEGSGGRVTDYR